ncbi:5'-methylthioadenosine/S-adenosylhomocysteine nucleosidase [Kitasatospora sp. NPDC093806]|uniref:5'-methylthioadenosine/S-adenosylhomocysteine nucleosidase n=1 Tax=Kitasatospora sp. NPDC093806 TaxID=3155075 RepID=UPI0034156D2B
MPTVVVLTALNLELRAVGRLLTDTKEFIHRSGTIFQVGTVPGGRCKVALGLAGEGNLAAAVVTGHAQELFDPAALLFVGVAGALKPELRLGDVVVATKVHAYQGGKIEADGTFSARPNTFTASHLLAQRANHVAVSDNWAKALPAAPNRVPEVFFKPVAAGDVVLNSTTSPLAQQLRHHYNDAAAIEMESAGAAHAGHVSGLPTLTIRGISDHADGDKQLADADGSQQRAAAHAAAFAMALVAELVFPDRPRPTSSGPMAAEPTAAPAAGPIMNVHAASGGSAFAVQQGTMTVNDSRPAPEPRWRTAPVALTAPGLAQILGRTGPSVELVELHLLPVPAPEPVEFRRLEDLPGELLVHALTDRLFPDQPVRTSVIAETALVETLDRRPYGIAVDRAGRRSAWAPLPHDQLGAVVDPDHLRVTFERMLTALATVDLPRPQRVVPVVGVERTLMVSEGQVGDLPRRSARVAMRDTPLFTPGTESVGFEVLAEDPVGLASELTARLLHLFRHRPH